jgi:hypothetical protein
MGDNMQQNKKETFFNSNNPEVIEERNKLLAAWLGKELKYDDAKIQETGSQLKIIPADPASRNLREFLYERLWIARPDISREKIQQVIIASHQEAFDRLQKKYPDMWNIWVAVQD